MDQNHHIAFIEELNKVVSISPEAKKFIASRVTLCNYKKGDYIFRTGDVCEFFYFVKKGLVRAFFNHQNDEITTWICSENAMVTSISGYFTQTPSLESAQCLEKTQLERFYIRDMHECLSKFPELNEAYRKMLELYYAAGEMRSHMARIPSAKDRYQFYCTQYDKEFVDRVPKKHLASLLNVRPETLSRISKSVKKAQI